MSLEHAILGFLQYRPLSGYDLKSVFDRSVRHFWPADQSQIYRILSRLSEKGLVDMEVIEQDEHPDRKVYAITGEGREELHRWLTTPLPQKGERIAELIQVFFAGQLTDDEALALFQRFAEHLRENLSVLRQVPQQGKGDKPGGAPPARDAFFWMLTLDYGIHMTEASLNWVEDVIARMERGEHLSAVTGGPDKCPISGVIHNNE